MQLSTLELNQEIDQALADNPLLERDDDPQALAMRVKPDGSIAADVPLSEAVAEPSNGQDAPAPAEPTELPDSPMDGGSLIEWRGNSDATDEDDTSPTNWVGTTLSLREHLRAQIACQASQRDRALVELLVEALDDDGYLHPTLDELLTMCPPEAAVEPEELSPRCACCKVWIRPASARATPPNACYCNSNRCSTRTPSTRQKFRPRLCVGMPDRAGASAVAGSA